MEISMPPGRDEAVHGTEMAWNADEEYALDV